MADKTLTHGDKGNFDDLRFDTIDPSDIEDKQSDPRFGLPKFLSWTLLTDNTGEPYWEAKGKDGKIYKILSDEVKVKKKGKVEIT